MNKSQEEKLRRFEGKGFSEAQLYEIKEGIASDLDVSYYARQGMPPEEMSYIRKKLNFEAQCNGLPEKQEKFEEVDEQFEALKETREYNLFEKIITFAMVMGVSAMIFFLFAVLLHFGLGR